jgi:hypothetical protein
MDDDYMKQIKQQSFADKLQVRLQESSNKNLQKLSNKDIQKFISLFWEVLATCLYDGYRVIFDGWISFYTNPVKRKCYDTGRIGNKWSFKYRVRSKPLNAFRNHAERELTEESYQELIDAKKTSKKQ